MALEFQTPELYFEWEAGVMAIKNHSSSITNDGEYPAWFDRVNSFRQRWGDRMLPVDIKIACHDIQDNLSLPRTVFEE